MGATIRSDSQRAAIIKQHFGSQLEESGRESGSEKDSQKQIKEDDFIQEIKRGSYTIGKDKERESLISEMSSQRTTRPRVHSTSAKTKFQKDVFSMEID